MSLFFFILLQFSSSSSFFFFNDTATTEIYTLPLHDALPICHRRHPALGADLAAYDRGPAADGGLRSEEHTSELQSRSDLVCRLLLEKKKKNTQYGTRARPRAMSERPDLMLAERDLTAKRSST